MTMVMRLPELAVFNYCRSKWHRSKVIWLSLFYNDHCDFSYVMDTLMEPMIWFVDNYVKYLGPLFVGFLIGMMGMVIVLTYFIIVPYEWQRKSYFEICFYMVIGHWLLINVLFHYYSAYNTEPGFPPVGRVLPEVVGMCKKCVAPKPPRTHHCRVCNRCILKMDHHCPWLNQCVGHYNHRYFFCTMFFMWLGCVFIVIGVWPCFAEHYWIDQPVALWCLKLNRSVSYAKYLCNDDVDVDRSSEANGVDEEFEEKPQMEVPDQSSMEVPEDEEFEIPDVRISIGSAAQTSILFVFFTSAAVIVGVGALMCWHARLIARGETSIEQHINKQTRKQFAKEGKVYASPYNFGVRQNIIRFLGLNAPGRSFWRHVILPSSHPPVGDGLVWESSTFFIDHGDCNPILIHEIAQSRVNKRSTSRSENVPAV